MYGLLSIIRSLPLQNLDTILFYMEEFNWKSLCKGVGEGYHFEDILSLSPKSIFQNPDLFTTDDTIIELNHDFYFEEASLTQALQAVATIYFEMMTQLDQKYQEKKIVPIGFYEGGTLEAFITFNDVDYLLIQITNGLTSRTELLELLIKSLNKGKSIHCKLVAVITKKGVVDFKLFKINLNVLLIDGNSIFSAKKDLVSTDFIRFFTNSREASYFSTYVPFNKMQILNCLSKEREEAQMEGRFTQSMVIDTIFAMVDGQRQNVISNVSVLANKALFIAKLGEKYDLLYQLTYIIQSGSGSQAVSWVTLELPVVDKFFDDFYIEMRRSFADYESIHLDGLLSRIMNLHQFVYKLFQKSNYTGKELEYIWDKAKWIKLRKTVAKIKGMLEAMSSYLLIVARTRIPTGA